MKNVIAFLLCLLVVVDKPNVAVACSEVIIDNPFSSEMIDNYSYNSMDKVVLEMNMVKGVNTLTQSMINKANTIYIIRYDYVLGEEITIPSNCVLEFNGGSLSNGVLNMNHSQVNAPNVKVFDSVKINNIGNNEFNAEWVLGTDENVSRDLFGFLPKVPINFNNRTYKVNSSINISMYAVWKNLNLFVHSISFSGELLGKVGCYKDSHLPLITLVSEPDFDVAGKLALIKTANHVAYDWRDDSRGIPTLYKGMSTICSGYNSSNSRCYINDNMENFPANVSYNGHKLISSVLFANPAKVELYNCKITTTKLPNSKLAGGMAIVYATDIKLVDCEICTDNNVGTESLCSIRQCVGGTVDRCNVHHAWFSGSQESYGIQCNASTRINIVNSHFSFNRRSVDFSGEYETRYSVVDNCFVSGGTDIGSGVGSHSTSYGNTFRNNIITGSFTYGIWCRGENEIVEGNNILSVHSGAIISTGYKTRIANNSNQFNRAIKQNTAIALYDIPNVTDNEIVIQNNSFLISSAVFDIPYGDSFSGKITLTGNIIDFDANQKSKSVTERVFKKHVDNVELIGNVYNFDTNQNNSVFAESANVTKGKFNCTIPVKLVYWSKDTREISDEEKEKITSCNCYLICDWTSEVHKMQLFVEFTINDDLSGPIGIVPAHFKSIDTKPQYTPEKNSVAGWMNDDAQEFTYWISSDIIYFGKGTQYNGIFTKGHYYCVIEWS